MSLGSGELFSEAGTAVMPCRRDADAAVMLTLTLM